MFRSGLLLAALVGCGAPGDRDAAAVDAHMTADAPSTVDASDAPSDAPLGPVRLPFTTTGSTPAGSLDDVQALELRFVGGNCPGTYYLELFEANTLGPVVTFAVTIPPNATQPPTGTIAATATTTSGSTDQVSFEIVQLDIPPSDPMRIAGRMTIQMGAWNVDFTVDALVPHMVCLIL